MGPDALTPMEGDKVEVVEAMFQTKRSTKNSLGISGDGPAVFHSLKFLEPSPEAIKRHIPDDLPKNKTNAHLTACFCKYRQAALHEKAEKILLSDSQGNLGAEKQMELLRLLQEMVRITFSPFLENCRLQSVF